MRTVLLAYERDQDVAAVETLLQSRGLHVVVARSGVEALEVARREVPQVVVSDVLLPRLDGFALCRRLREDPLLAHLPVLLHSFRVEGPKYEAFAAEVGAHRFLTRRSTLEELAGAIEEQLQGSGTVRMPALSIELIERREQDRHRVEELERRLHALQSTNQQLAAAERVAREAAVNAARERDEAIRADGEGLRALEERRREADDRVAALESRLAELQESRARVQAAALDTERAFAAQPVPTWLVDMATHEIRLASDSAAALFGIAREPLRGRSITELLPGSVPAGDVAEAVEARLVRPDRPPLALELCYHPVTYDGRACWITSAREVTAEHADRVAREAVDRSALALEASPVATCIADAEGRLLHANGAFLALLGLDAEAVADAALGGFEPADGGDDATARETRAGGGVPGRRETRWQRRDGTTFDAELAIAPLDAAADLRIVTVRDLSEHRRAVQRAVQDQQCAGALLALTQRAPSLTEAEVVAQALDVACELTGSESGGVLVSLAEAGQLELAGVHGADTTRADLVSLRRWRGAPPAGTALAECLDTRQVVVRDAPEDMDWLRASGLPASVRNQVCAPLLDGGRLAGIVLVAGKPGAYDADDRRHLTRIADALARIMKRRRSDAEIVSAMDHMERVMLGVVESLAGLAESQEAGRAGRARRVADLAAGIGSALGLPGHTVRGLRLMGQLIDVGMLRIPREILWRPGQLTPAEYELVKTHVECGYELLCHVEFPWPVAEVVRQHHERLDGSGYPRGLRGEAILLEARIVAVADAAEAMLSPRPQRGALSLTACVEELQSQAGRRYDARVVKACVKLLREREKRTEGEASVGQRIA
jgi:PAS domain S-box-containing protein